MRRKSGKGGGIIALLLILLYCLFLFQNEMDLGTVLCWARNSVGRQERPCVFHLIAARRPNPVANCTVADRALTELSITCMPGFDGGLKQVSGVFCI